MVSLKSNAEKHQQLDGSTRLDSARTKAPVSPPSLETIASETNGVTSAEEELKVNSSTNQSNDIMSDPPTIDIEDRVLNGQGSPENEVEPESDEVSDVESDNRKKQLDQQQPKKIFTRERKPDDRKQTRSQSPKNQYGRSVRPSLIQTPVVWPASNIPQWAQFGGYHYPGQGRMQAPLALITPYAPAYMPLGNGSGSRDDRLASSPLHSGSSYSPMHSSHAGEKLSKTNLYIRGLPSNTTDDDLVNMCKQYGAIISTKAILDKDTNKCKGYGFVDFDSPFSAQRAVASLQSKGVQAQMARQQEQDPTNLYLSNLPKTMDENQLQQLLSSYGRVVSTRILKDGAGFSKGVGFARMESREICQAVIAKLCGQHMQGSAEQLLVKFADGGPKKRPQQTDKVWRDNEGGYLTAYDVAHSTVSSMNNSGSTRVTAVMPGHMISYSQESSSRRYQQQPVTAGVGWVQSQPYAVAVSPHVPMSPTSVEPMNMTHVQQQQNVMPQHLTNQMAQMQLSNGAYLTAVPTVGAYAPQNTWHVSQPHTGSHHGQVEDSHFIVGSPDTHEASFPHIHGGSTHHIQHPNEAIIDDHHRMVYAAYPRK